MITCYLDSQDYSVLTDPKLDTPEHRQIKEALLYFARSKQVRFAFSATAICESIALTPDATHLAELRAGLLSELCGLNALVSLDRLVKAETSALARRTAYIGDMFDPDGRWFPEIPIDPNPEAPLERIRKSAEEEMKALGLSRQQRRAKSRTLIKNGKPRPALSAHLTQQNKNIFAEEILKKYPMHPKYAKIMTDYAFGQVTEKDFHEALMGSLVDPRWMIKWFTTEHAMSNPIADMVRKPGEELGQAMRSFAAALAPLAASLRGSGLDVGTTSKNGELASRWKEMETHQIISITRRLADTIGIELGEYDARDVRTFCPGLATAIGSLYSSIWENVGGGQKEKPSDSQPIDALHASYAPYIHVFRADRFMTPHIQKQVKNFRTIVVPRLPQLVDALEKQIR